MDLNGDETLYGKSLGSNQAVFVVDFLTIVSEVRAPGHHLMMGAAFNGSKIKSKSKSKSTSYGSKSLFGTTLLQATDAHGLHVRQPGWQNHRLVKTIGTNQ
jgi:hypothetical protein